MQQDLERRGFADHRPLPEPRVGAAPTRQTWERRRRRCDPLKTGTGKLNFGLTPRLYAAAERLRRCYGATERAGAVPCLPLERIAAGGRGRVPLAGVWLPFERAFGLWQGACGARRIWWHCGEGLRGISLRLLAEEVVVYGLSAREVERLMPGFRREWIGPALRWALDDFARRTEER